MSRPTFLERLRASGILSSEQLQELVTLPEAKEADPRALALTLLKRGWLTRFQINQIAAGKGKELQVGHYVLLDRLGEGGMGQVFKAQHCHMGRVVALKFMRKEKLSRADSVTRFFKEVQAAGKLTHPNIVMAFDAGKSANGLYFSMELVDGPDLARLVRERGPLPVEQACDFIRQAALGLQHAHEQGLVHRDIKPSNLLVTGGSMPVVKILDMGLARLDDSFEKDRNLTKMGQVIGTPDYLAPEQALDARNVDTRADVYSLGCTLFFLLTGRAPFQAESLTELLLKHQSEPPPPLCQLRPDAPATLEALLARMMAKHPDQRPATPAEVAAELEPLSRGEASVIVAVEVTLLPPPSVQDDAWAALTEDDGRITRTPFQFGGDHSHNTIVDRRSSRRRAKRSHPLLIGAGVLLIVAIAGGAFFLMQPTKKQAEPASPTKQPRDAVVKPPGDDRIFAIIEEAVRSGQTAKTQFLGGGSKEFIDVPNRGALLVGFEVGIGKSRKQDVIHSLRAIFRGRKGRVLGPVWGKKQERLITLEARPGYAVGRLNLRAGTGLDGISLTFMAIDGDNLNRADHYDSDWAGGFGGNPRILAGDGRPIVGIFGKLQQRTDIINGLGVVLIGAPRVKTADGRSAVEKKPGDRP
jgi:serine/threonine protein kinase